MQVYKFGNCYLNVTERHVVKNEKHLELTPKTFDVLQFLVERRGEIVTKDELLGKVWNGSFVEEGNLAVHISKLRRLLDASRTQPFIETVAGSGYRFVSSVEMVSDDEWQKQLSAENGRHKDKLSDELVFDSIAVLPLQNESNDSEIEYLADGLTESFINSLSHISGLKVIARNTVFRYKNKEVESQEVSQTLGVKTILTGRIRLIRDRLSIGVELVKTEDGTQIWGTQINHPFSGIIEIQEEIISTVSEKLKSEVDNVSKSSIARPITHDSESYRLYLKGKYFFEKRTVEDMYKAIEYFQKSVLYDPTNVYSYVEMVECYCLLYGYDYISYDEVLTKTRPILSVISKLNQSVDTVQVMYAGVKMYLEWKFEEAENHLKRALNINPKCLPAHYRYSFFLVTSGRFPEALEELNQIMLIDPLSLFTYIKTGRLLCLMERYENAITCLKEAIELEPKDYEALVILGGAFTELGNYDEALDSFQKSLDSHYNLDTLAMIGYTHAKAGNCKEAYNIIEQLKFQSGGQFNPEIKLAAIYLALGEKEKAYDYLDQAFNQHYVDLVALKCAPVWSSIKGESRFKELVVKIGIPM